MSEIITLTAGHDGFAFTALHAQPEGPRKGGVIVIQEIFGLDRYVREDVARWAAKGFEVIAPSMFDRQEKSFTAEHDPAGFETRQEFLFRVRRPGAHVLFRLLRRRDLHEQLGDLLFLREQLVGRLLLILLGGVQLRARLFHAAPGALEIGLER